MHTFQFMQLVENALLAKMVHPRSPALIEKMRLVDFFQATKIDE